MTDFIDSDFIIFRLHIKQLLAQHTHVKSVYMAYISLWASKWPHESML